MEDEPLIQIEVESEFVENEPALKKALFFRKSLHLLYDYICDPFLIKEVVLSEMHLVTREHIFTLRNISNIQNGKFCENTIV